MASVPFPASIEDVTAEWLDTALKAAGAIGEASVTGFGSEPIGEGVGVMCELYRIRPVYAGDAVRAPETVVLKVPVDQEGTRFVARTFRFYEMEVDFYRTAATMSPLATPGCFAAEHDPVTDAFVLLLEEITGARTYSQVEGCPPDIAETCIVALARHHAAFWEHEVLDSDLTWLPYPWDPPIPQAIQEGAAASLPVFLDGFSYRFDDHIRALCERFPEVTGDLFNFGDDRPLTFVHGDYHVGNLFFRDNEVVAFDWQFPLRTGGAYDLGYFLSQNLTIEDRRTYEGPLIDLYLSTLAEFGVDYSLDILMVDYRRMLLICLMPQILAGGGMQLVDGALRLVNERLDRVVAAIHDHDAGELMP